MFEFPKTIHAASRLLAFLTIGFLPTNLIAEPKNTTGGFIDFNAYPYLSDVDNDNVITINIAAKLSNRFSYFSLINFGNQSGHSELEDTVTYYTEQNVRWKIAENSPLDLTLQLNFRTGENNDRHRLGFRWRISNTTIFSDFFKQLNLGWSVNFHLLQIDHEENNVWQMEHSFRLTFPYLSERLYFAGFLDHTFNEDLPRGYPSSPIVGEAQLGYRISGNFFAIAEYRVNQYRRSDVNNLAIGFEYKINW
ncbi:MAG: hypothetical protein ACI89U_001033 [Gammaproteobacteria bacterium]|jgi:hypothetical protein